MRVIASSILTNRTKALIICDHFKVLDRSDAIKLCNGLSAALLWCRDMDIPTQEKSFKELDRQLPVKVTPSVSNWMTVASMHQMAARDSTSSFYSLQQFTKYQRNVVTAFASLLNRGRSLRDRY